MKNNRTKLLGIIECCPEEVWGNIVVTFISKTFPKSLGGFSPESRRAIKELIKESEHYRDNFGHDV